MHTQEGGGQGEGGKEGERVKGGGKKECKKEEEAKSKATTQWGHEPPAAADNL